MQLITGVINQSEQLGVVMNEPETFWPLELLVNMFTARDIPLGTIDFP